MKDEVLVKVEGVSKKFCRNLKRSLAYGVQDLTYEILGKDRKESTLRKDEFWAVKDVSFELKRGECLGLIGHNGAGKSTLLKMLNGLIKPDAGKITMKGRIGALIELGAGFNPILTGRENIYINGQILGFSRKEINEKFSAIVDFAEICDFIDTPVQNYSSGMKVRLGFAVAAQMEPDVLIIDEVLAVGDANFRMKCLNQITKIIDKCAVIFVSHSMIQVGRVSTDLIIMKNGISKVFNRDTNKGINEFLTDQSIVTSGRVNPSFSESEYGEIVLLDLKFRNSEGAIMPNLYWNKDYTLELVLDSTFSTKNCTITLIFDNGELSPVSCINFKNDLYSGENKINKKLENLVLSAGVYSYRLLIFSEDSRTILRVQSGAVIKVKGTENFTMSYTEMIVK